jgi:hypothetical protein
MCRKCCVCGGHPCQCAFMCVFVCESVCVCCVCLSIACACVSFSLSCVSVSVRLHRLSLFLSRSPSFTLSLSLLLSLHRSLVRSCVSRGDHGSDRDALQRSLASLSDSLTHTLCFSLFSHSRSRTSKRMPFLPCPALRSLPLFSPSRFSSSEFPQYTEGLANLEVYATFINYDCYCCITDITTNHYI